MGNGGEGTFGAMLRMGTVITIPHSRLYFVSLNSSRPISILRISDVPAPIS